MGLPAQLLVMCIVGASGVAYYAAYSAYGADRKAVMQSFDVLSKRLGVWTMPVFVAVHTLAIATCFPYAVMFEAGAAFLFGFFSGVLCVFSAKVLGAAAAFGIGRVLFQCSPWLTDLVRRNKYYNILNRGVREDGWKFVLLARFSPVPSYIINYGLAATDVRFFVDFLLPTLVGGLPMILQNTSFGTLTSATIGGSQRSPWSYILPVVGMCSGVLITWKVRKYASDNLATEDGVQKQEVKKAYSEGVILEAKRTQGNDGKVKQRRSSCRE